MASYESSPPYICTLKEPLSIHSRDPYLYAQTDLYAIDWRHM